MNPSTSQIKYIIIDPYPAMNKKEKSIQPNQIYEKKSSIQRFNLEMQIHQPVHKKPNKSNKNP